MNADSSRYAGTIARFDAVNAGDPNTEIDEGQRRPKELLYAERMTAMLERFAPDAPETVRLAARCQHIQRWEVPRASYPANSEGYNAWRTRLRDHHAEVAGAIMREGGYDEATIAAVAALIRKERLKRNADAQLLEDVVGLVFVQHYLAGFVATHPQYDELKFTDILKKTFRKMSPRGVAAAPTLSALSPELAAFVARAADAARPMNPQTS